MWRRHEVDSKAGQTRNAWRDCPNAASGLMPLHPLGRALFNNSPEFIGIARAGRCRKGIPTSRD